MKRALVIVLLTALPGCIGRPPARTPGLLGGPATPSPKQVSDCESLRTQHNAWVLLGTIFGTVAGAGGSAAGFVQNDHDMQLGIGIGAAASGLLGAISTTVAGFSADSYSTKNCNDVLKNAPP